ncbi:hypothetical protein ACROYT_G002312 [Oculina patagonica]
MGRILLSSLVIFVFTIFSENKIGESRVCTNTRCTCSRDEENITAVCRMSKLENISQSFNNPRAVHTLNLSNNKIRAIEKSTFENFSGLMSLEMSRNLLEELLPNSFAGLKNLINLSLTYTNIQVIRKDAFSELYSLQTLYLTGNKLQIWNTHGASLHLPSLMIIDVQGNMGWRPEEKYLLELPNLMEVRDVSWDADCLDCWLIRNVSEYLINMYNNSHFRWSSSFECFKKQFTFSDYLVLLARHHFVVRKCRSLINCIFRNEAHFSTCFPCWTLIQRVVLLLLVLGILGCCLNVIVVFNTLLTKSLRRNSSMVLVGNLALGDTLTCVYSAIIAAIIVNNDYKNLFEYPNNFQNTQCPKLGTLWLLGQCTSSITSVALTLERYLCIVFSMKPDIRMTPRLAFLAIAYNWVVAAFMMFIAHYFHIYRRTLICIPVALDTLHYPIETYYTFALVSGGISLYLVTIPMYVHIYWVVKRSSQQMGVQRESTLAKRIAILVGTNLVFFFTPIISLGVLALFTQSTGEMQWMTPFSLIINSCLNPLVHAFRNDKFKNALKRNLPLTCHASNVTAPAVHIAPSGGVHNRRNVTTTVQAARSGGVRYTRNMTSAVQAASSGSECNKSNVTAAVQTASSGGVSNVTAVVEAAYSGGVRNTSTVTPAMQSASSKEVK